MIEKCGHCYSETPTVRYRPAAYGSNKSMRGELILPLLLKATG